MGLTGFYPLLKKKGYLPGEVTLSELRGKTVAIDGDFLLYKALLGHTTGEGVPPTEIALPILRWLRLAARAGVRTIFVTTGGPPPKEKLLHCAIGRKRKRERQEERIHAMEKVLTTQRPSLGVEIQLRDRIVRLRNGIRRIEASCTVQVVNILQSQGFECRQAKSEADFLLVLLSEEGSCEFVATEDADILVSGAVTILRGFVGLLVEAVAVSTLYRRTDILECLGLTSDELVQLGILMACDYQPPIQNLGPVTALAMIQRFSTIADFLGSEVFHSTIKKSQTRKFTLPNNLTVGEYLTASARTRQIFRSRPDLQEQPQNAPDPNLLVPAPTVSIPTKNLPTVHIPEPDSPGIATDPADPTVQTRPTD